MSGGSRAIHVTDGPEPALVDRGLPGDDLGRVPPNRSQRVGRNFDAVQDVAIEKRLRLSAREFDDDVIHGPLERGIADQRHVEVPGLAHPVRLGDRHERMRRERRDDRLHGRPGGRGTRGRGQQGKGQEDQG